MIKLIKGSIFDSKCDLIIIPCDSLGGVTYSMAKELTVHDLPYYHRDTIPGNVLFFENVGSFSNATAIGYAASVDASNIKSNETILHNIMRKIRNYCREQSLSKVNIPLLGTGAGGLNAKISFKIMESEFKSDPNIILCIYAFSEIVYKELMTNNPEKQIKNPRVFISYTGTDVKNRAWVKNLAYKLRSSGVNARLDVFHLKPGQDLPQWMTNEIIMADKVLLICDRYYAEKADNRKGGVGWETMIIQGDMLSRQEQDKYVAILRDKDIDQSLPIYVKSRYALNWADDSQIDKEFNDLLLYLFDCDNEPDIGEVPSFIKEKLKK